MRAVLIGFDSAWTDKNPGAIAAYVLEGLHYETFHEPCSATFGYAGDFIREVTIKADYILIAIDQPTIVPNYDGLRPVDRVAGSLVGKLGGGVQPARSGGKGAPMFGESAPIRRFLSNVGAKQNPIDARSATAGRFLMEVFPALALPAIVPEIWRRRKAAKYNPRAKKFSSGDWKIVSSGVASFARSLNADALAIWLEKQALIERPKKADQDCLDAAICLAIALAWRMNRDTLLIGDEQEGYIANIASAQTREVLVNAAEKRGVGVDRAWEGSAASPI